MASKKQLSLSGLSRPKLSKKEKREWKKAVALCQPTAQHNQKVMSEGRRETEKLIKKANQENKRFRKEFGIRRTPRTFAEMKADLEQNGTITHSQFKRPQTS